MGTFGSLLVEPALRNLVVSGDTLNGSVTLLPKGGGKFFPHAMQEEHMNRPPIRIMRYRVIFSNLLISILLVHSKFVVNHAG